MSVSRCLKQICGILVAATTAQPLAAEVITLNVIGTITFVDTALLPQFSIGEALTGTISYNTSLPDANPSPNLRNSPSAANLSLTFGDYLATAVGGALFVDHRPGFMDFLQSVAGGLNGAAVGAPVEGLLLRQIDVLLNDDDGMTFSSDTPTAAELMNVTNFETRLAVLQFAPSPLFPREPPFEGPDGTRVFAEISALQQVAEPIRQVAEPSSVALISICVAAFGMRRRRNKT